MCVKLAKASLVFIIPNLIRMVCKFGKLTDALGWKLLRPFVFLNHSQNFFLKRHLFRLVPFRIVLRKESWTFHRSFKKCLVRSCKLLRLDTTFSCEYCLSIKASWEVFLLSKNLWVALFSIISENDSLLFVFCTGFCRYLLFNPYIVYSRS